MIILEIIDSFSLFSPAAGHEGWSRLGESLLMNGLVNFIDHLAQGK